MNQNVVYINREMVLNMSGIQILSPFAIAFPAGADLHPCTSSIAVSVYSWPLLSLSQLVAGPNGIASNKLVMPDFMLGDFMSNS